MEYHKVTKKIQSLLKQNSCWFEVFKHEPVKTSEEALKVTPSYALNQGAKTIIVRVKKAGGEKQFMMLVFPAHLKFDNKKVKMLLGAKDIRFATEQEVLSLTNGVKLGAIPPFGSLFGLEVIVDNKLFKNEKIVFSAGDRKLSIAMKSGDYKRLVNPKIGFFV